ncbi:Transposase [Dyadobacter sp. SG02]|nr:Transposase [Dyadobacter sp. SG02]
MKKSKFTEVQIAYALRQSEAGTRVEDICRQMGVSQAIFLPGKRSLVGWGLLSSENCASWRKKTPN